MERKKEFALRNIAPYYKDPTTCGYDGNLCTYLTKEGKSCVAGKNMIDPSKWGSGAGIMWILENNKQEDVFKPEAAGMLTPGEWGLLQALHDGIAFRNDIERRISDLNLFTLEELKQYTS